MALYELLEPFEFELYSAALRNFSACRCFLVFGLPLLRAALSRSPTLFMLELLFASTCVALSFAVLAIMALILSIVSTSESANVSAVVPNGVEAEPIVGGMRPFSIVWLVGEDGVEAIAIFSGCVCVVPKFAVAVGGDLLKLLAGDLISALRGERRTCSVGDDFGLRGMLFLDNCWYCCCGELSWPCVGIKTLPKSTASAPDDLVSPLRLCRRCRKPAPPPPLLLLFESKDSQCDEIASGEGDSALSGMQAALGALFPLVEYVLFAPLLTAVGERSAITVLSADGDDFFNSAVCTLYVLVFDALVAAAGAISSRCV